ncbi:hypothetical protein FOPG_17460 [Fusarium oxysporum f. sp. conglutinans race 2 54008]|uniref:NmrA-like domain-containing protein n=2 Tax=Fusarium oxysporum f. sp. conglutinans TaxID=100902 RepID=F9FF49_FUSOF|nr:hypothetical protein FOXB_05028 [Fusarium oxysporum f. sp. conglutinans Fo5176]EXL66359.1 hypothetical protein FOPG_17460 [Fusarium oxysporum f. sp. conglutinans race 2 54008]KAG6988125.1 NmrA-like family domain-containing protein 1 [Fusarium oxysporum f. sp. conglutinans]KAI8414119.1 hypothetical protein FOFC_07410 [Fusarium oxysporum]KAI8414146.1 hypothetical protein FOFC_07437 [Fusarium oxysporum]
MANKIITILGINGQQGSSVANVFLREGGWHVRGVTRDPSKPTSKVWADKGVDLVEADLNDVASLKAAFAGSSVIFGVTDFWGILGDPKVQERAQAAGRPINVFAYDVEVQHGRNIVDAANAALDTLERFVLSTLSPTKRLSKGKYTHNFHFDAKWEAVEYLKATYPALVEKTSYLQVAAYLTNWKTNPLFRPKRQPDGTFVLSIPGNPDAPVAQVDAGRDTGKSHATLGTLQTDNFHLDKFVKALLQVKPGKNLLGCSTLLTWNEYAALWGKIHGVTCRFVPLDRKVVEEAIPGGIGEELADMFEYIGDFGYHGGDPTITFPKDLGVDVPVYTLEEYIKGEDWSEVLAVSQ